MGWIWWRAGNNLLAPVVAHALYDFLALYYLLRIRRTQRTLPHNTKSAAGDISEQ